MSPQVKDGFFTDSRVELSVSEVKYSRTSITCLPEKRSRLSKTIFHCSTPLTTTYRVAMETEVT